MSEPLQLGKHPDADQLSAFVEHTLPAHEQEQTLAHLAKCEGCRKIVALSLPPLEDAPSLEPEPVVAPRFGGWFSGWKLAWLAVPALAAAVILAVHLRNTATGRRQAAQPAQVAALHPPSPQAGAPRESAPQAVKASAAPQDRPSESAAQARRPNPSRYESDTNSLPVNGREFAIVKTPPRVAQPIGGPILGNSSMEGIASGAGAAPVQNAADLAPQASAAAPSTIFLTRNGQPLLMSQAAPAAKAPSPVSATTATGTLTENAVVTYAAPAGQARVFAASSALRKNGSVSVLAPLPSGQPVLSSVTELHQVAAIDGHHNLFYSADGGRHWQQISPPWHGLAISVALLSPASASPNGLSFAVPERFTPGVSDSAEPVAYPDATGISLSGTVTDSTGAVVPGATVLVKETRYDIARMEKADAAGHYLFTNLAPGIYAIDAQAPGFVKLSLVEDLLPAQQAVRDLTLSVGQVSQTVTVDAASVQLETQSSTIDTPVDRAESIEARTATKQRPFSFVVTTDSGERWISFDGRSWKLE